MNILLINAHKYYSFSEGKLNTSLIEQAQLFFAAQGHNVKTKRVDSNADYNVDEEIADHQWANLIILQTPINWMGVPWTFKKYMDDVYTPGVDGRLCYHDGRSSTALKKNYGGGGLLTNTKYMLSVTFNAPAEAFNDHSEYLFEGKSVDDLLFPMYMNFRFFGMQKVDTFACFDVVKNQDIQSIFNDYQHHLELHFGNSNVAAC